MLRKDFGNMAWINNYNTGERFEWVSTLSCCASCLDEQERDYDHGTDYAIEESCCCIHREEYTAKVITGGFKDE
jgi:hypothetical protein